MSGLSDRAGDLVGSWPPGGLVVGLLPAPSDPPWAGRAALALARATAARRKPALILDLAPKDTNLASRFGAADETGFAELVEGEVRLWEIVHRHPGGDAFYVPCGLRTPGAELARSPAARTLADRVRDAGRILLVPLDRRGAGKAASAGWVDGFVRIGDRSVSAARLSGGAQVLGHLERSDEAPRTRETEPEGEDPTGRSGRDSGTRREDAPRARHRRPDTASSRGDGAARKRSPGGSRSRMSLPRRRRRSGGRLRKAGRAVLAAAMVLAAGLAASTWLGGPGWQEVREAAETVTGGAGDGTLPAAGPAPDSAAADRRETVPSAAADSVSSPVPPAGDSGSTPPR